MLAAERERNEARQDEVSSAASALKAAGEEQRAEVAAVKGELRDQKESYRVQVQNAQVLLYYLCCHYYLILF